MIKFLQQQIKETLSRPRIVFMGSADFSVPILLALIKKFKVVGVVTEVDRPQGRGLEILPPETKVIAKNCGIPVFQPLELRKNPRIVEDLEKLNPDLIVVAAYGKIVPESILNLPKHGCLNVHPSLLPEWRGASPIQSALLEGQSETGVTIILMDSGMDTGDIVVQEKLEIAPFEDYRILERRLANLSAGILLEAIDSYIAGEIGLKVQNDQLATYCNKIQKQHGRINWQDSATRIHNKMRAFSQWPGCYTLFKGKKLDLIQAEMEQVEIRQQDAAGQIFKRENRIYIKCGEGCLRLVKIKLEGKKEMLVSDFVNGYPGFIGSVLV